MKNDILLHKNDFFNKLGNIKRKSEYVLGGLHGGVLAFLIIEMV